MAFAKPTANQAPIGAHEGADNYATWGWACDADNYATPLVIHFYDGPTFVGAVTANQPRPELAPQCSGQTAHGFVWYFPASLRDGHTLSLQAYALNIGELGDNVLLSTAPQTLALTSASPIGYLDAVVNNQLVGWALDVDDPAAQIDVHFYVNGPTGTAQALGSVRANQPRGDVNQVTGYPGHHGFRWEIPPAFRQGYRVFYAYGIDAVGGNPNVALAGVPLAVERPPNGEVQLRTLYQRVPLVLKTSAKYAGAIYSLTWNGKEFINSTDHGRELQTALAFNDWGECYNPTEAGAQADGASNDSTSHLMLLNTGPLSLTTITQMAFWAHPQVAPQTLHCGSATQVMHWGVLSNHILRKDVQLNFQDWANIIEYQAQFTIPPNEAFSSANFEVVTGYMPSEFSKFWTYLPATRRLTPLAAGAGEQRWPVIFSTPDERYALGVYAPQLPQAQYPELGFGRFRFPDTVKWNCVFRATNILPSSTHTFRCYLIVGTLRSVANTMTQLHYYFYPTPKSLNGPR